jgi:hypothetical protein
VAVSPLWQPHNHTQTIVIWPVAIEVAKRLGVRRLAAALLDNQSPCVLKWTNGTRFTAFRRPSCFGPDQGVFPIANVGFPYQYRLPNEAPATGDNERKVRSILLLAAREL